MQNKTHPLSFKLIFTLKSGKSNLRRFVYFFHSGETETYSSISVPRTTVKNGGLKLNKRKIVYLQFDLWEMMKYRHATKQSLDPSAVINSTLKSLNSIL